jgi:hypothetical protein
MSPRRGSGKWGGGFPGFHQADAWFHPGLQKCRPLRGSVCKDLYQKLGVDELFLYDPMEEYLHPGLQGFRLAETGYRPIEPEQDGSLFSRSLGLTLKLEESGIRLMDPKTGERLLRRTELLEEKRALEKELARLRAAVES